MAEQNMELCLHNQPGFFWQVFAFLACAMSLMTDTIVRGSVIFIRIARTCLTLSFRGWMPRT
jgi:hypothetical protein